MMATISDFRAALDRPAAHFKRLADIACTGNGIVRSTYFAEATVERRDGLYRLYMPLRPDSLRYAELFTVRKRHIVSPLVPKMEILREEMYCGEMPHRTGACDMLLEPAPAGITLAEAIRGAIDASEAAALLEALGTLQASLDKADISLHNLREENIVVDAAGVLRPVRWYYAAVGRGRDEEAFDRIRAHVTALFPQTAGAAARQPAALPLIGAGHMDMQPMSEGLTAVLDAKGWGFVDCDDRTVVRPRFKWVSCFCEGRAMVETQGGMMGLIDRRGRYVIPPRYKIVEYDSRSGNSHVCRGRKWGVFDYSGRQIADFTDTKPAL